MTAGAYDGRMARSGRVALGLGVVALAASVVAATRDPDAFYRAWLASYVFWVGIPLGSLAILQLHYVSGGRWGIVIRRVAEAAAATLPLMVLLFVPVVVGVRPLFPWARPDVVAASPELQEQSVYLNVPFFLGRAAVCFALWIALATTLGRWSRRRDGTPDPHPRRFRLVSGPGLVAYGITVTLVAIDWGMSLEPRWWSTVYPMLFGVAQVLSGFAFTIAVAVWLRDQEPFGRLLNASNLIDLGNLLLTFVLLWAYLAYSQFMLIWAGDIREEVAWYLPRTAGGWGAVALALIAGHFVLPFALLLHRPLKRRPRVLAAIAWTVLAMQLVDDYWWILPSAPTSGVPWVAFTTPLALGGLWVAAFLWRLRGVPLVPGNEPLVEPAMAAHGR